MSVGKCWHEQTLAHHTYCQFPDQLQPKCAFTDIDDVIKEMQIKQQRVEYSNKYRKFVFS